MCLLRPSLGSTIIIIDMHDMMIHEHGWRHDIRSEGSSSSCYRSYWSMPLYVPHCPSWGQWTPAAAALGSEHRWSPSCADAASLHEDLFAINVHMHWKYTYTQQTTRRQVAPCSTYHGSMSLHLLPASAPPLSTRLSAVCAFQEVIVLRWRQHQWYLTYEWQELIRPEYHRK